MYRGMAEHDYAGMASTYPVPELENP